MIKKNHFARVAQLAGSLGVAEANEDTIRGIPPLFPEPREIFPEDLLEYFGPVAPPLEDQPPSTMTLEIP